MSHQTGETASADAPAPQQAARTRNAGTHTALKWLLGVLRLGPFLILALLCVVLGALEPVFYSTINVQNVLVQSSVVAVLAIGQLIVILTGGIDLSIGSGMALATVVGALAFRGHVFDSGAAVVALMLLTGVGLGLVNGLIYVKGKVPHPFIVTLATYGAAGGIALTLADGQPITGMPPIVNTLGNGFVGQVPIPVFVVLGVAVAAWWLTQHTQWGRWIYATGGSPEAAQRVGIPVSRMLISVYALAGLAAGFAAILTAGSFGGGSATVGQLSALDAVAGVIIGGASFLGGRGSVWNALVGALTLGVIRNGLDLLGISPFTQYAVVGVTILLAVELDVLRAQLERRVRTLHAIERL
jgi:ribose transport system permease protein